jgi:hypothetical protein
MGQSKTKEFERMRRVADMLITGHELLKNRYMFLSLLTDVSIFACSLGLCVLVFVEPEKLSLYIGVRAKIVVGLFSFFTLVMTCLAGRLDWRVKAVKHASSAEKYFDFKKECNDSFDKIKAGNAETIAKLNEKYKAMSSSAEKISDKYFLKIKKKHNLKVLISKHLDKHPSISLIMFRIKLWLRDNLWQNKLS